MIDINSILGGLPQAVLIAAIIVIVFVYLTIDVVKKIEEKLEEKKGKQIKIFDHKKIWLSLFWCILACIILAVSNFIAWYEVPFYIFVIMGISTFLYESVVKRFTDENN